MGEVCDARSVAADTEEELEQAQILQKQAMDLRQEQQAAAEALVTGDESWKSDVGRSVQRSSVSEDDLGPAERARVEGALRGDLYDRFRS